MGAVSKKKEPCPHCLGTGQVQDQAEIGRKMKSLRRIKLRAVAQDMGISPGYLCYLENGKRRWTAELIDQYQQHCQ